MNTKTTVISQAELDAQFACCDKIAAYWQTKGRTPTAYVETYGCQQNEADSANSMRGCLAEMWLRLRRQDAERARIVIVINTCAIREHAEQRVFGNLGALTHTKRRHPEQIICPVRLHGAGDPGVRTSQAQPTATWTCVFGPHASVAAFRRSCGNVLSGRKRQFFM